MEIDERLSSLRTLVQDLQSTREHSQLSLASSLDTIVYSIAIYQYQLSNVSNYRARIFEYYWIGLHKNQFIDLHITKKQLIAFPIDPRTRVQPLVTKRCICVDWCTYQSFLENCMDSLFTVFGKPPHNNRDVPLYFLRKL